MSLGEAEAFDLINDSGDLDVLEYLLYFEIILMGLNVSWNTSAGRSNSFAWQYRTTIQLKSFSSLFPNLEERCTLGL